MITRVGLVERLLVYGQERARPKVGRMARLKGKVEKVEALPSRLPSSADDAELAAMLAKMREHA